ncbi:MAG: NADH-quinone oxidoreductase subunit N [Chitinophagaceae bacterium]|jgi:NADH-quinone oxidoreductase subunit N|nr:NADH-quinone oxidoreductase subunit N [Chitinophagaceae bacterium]
MNSIILSALWGVLMMYTGVVSRSNKAPGIMAALGAALLMGAAWLDLNGVSLAPFDLHGMLEFPPYVSGFILLMSLCLLLYVLLSNDEIDRLTGHSADYLALIFFVMTGVIIVASFKTLLMMFLGVEIMSIPLYILAASDKRNLKSNEAGLKYFLMGSFSTGIMLMGIALLYGSFGTFYTAALNIGFLALSPLTLAGIVLLMVSMAFKVSAAPFHFWTPDVYDGTPSVFTSFMATIVKAAAFFGFLRLFEGAFGKLHEQWQILTAIITAATLLIGNLTAVFQQSVKRMLAYSSIAQAGFMMFALFAMNATARQGLVLYGVSYSLATIGVFAVLAKMKDQTFEGFNGLATHKPFLALMLTVYLLSLAGIPLTAGFFAKYYMLLAALKTGQMLWLVILAVLSAAVGIYYYFRVIQAMYFKEGADQEVETSSGFRATLLVTAVIIVLLGVHPDWVIALVNY